MGEYISFYIKKDRFIPACLSRFSPGLSFAALAFGRSGEGNKNFKF
jgi:hypothetical protein